MLLAAEARQRGLGHRVAHQAEGADQALHVVGVVEEVRVDQRRGEWIALASVTLPRLCGRSTHTWVE